MVFFVVIVVISIVVISIEKSEMATFVLMSATSVAAEETISTCTRAVGHKCQSQNASEP